MQLQLFHFKFQYSAVHDLLVRNGVVFNRVSVEFHALDMNLVCCLIRRGNHEILAVFEMQNRFCEQRRPDDIFR